MSDALYVKVGDSVEALDLGTGSGTAPEYVERIEALESGLETVSTEALGVKADTVLAAENAADVSGGSLGDVDLNNILSAYEMTNAKADAAQASADEALAGLGEIADGVAKPDLSNVTDPVQAFKTMSVGWGMPDYSAGITLAITTTNTPVTGSGVIIGFQVCWALGVETLYVNDIAVSQYYSGGKSVSLGGCALAYVSSGDVYRIASPGRWESLTFYPFRGSV